MRGGEKRWKGTLVFIPLDKLNESKQSPKMHITLETNSPHIFLVDVNQNSKPPCAGWVIVTVFKEQYRHFNLPVHMGSVNFWPLLFSWTALLWGAHIKKRKEKRNIIFYFTGHVRWLLQQQRSDRALHVGGMSQQSTEQKQWEKSGTKRLAEAAVKCNPNPVD